ncbi:MAG: homoserine dehydrogenase [Parvibaculales bacterium]
MSKNLNIAIAGLGTVGANVAQRLLSHEADGLKLVAVSARERNKERGFSLNGLEWHDNPLAFTEQDNIDIVVELIGGADGLAYELVKTALARGKHVVTANKALLAERGLELAELAEKNQVSLAYEAAVAGGIPIIKTLREALSWNKVTRIRGILNGTCNYILSEMASKNVGFSETLKKAQELGFAEADPSFDIEGIDAGQKLSLLASLAFGVKPEFEHVQITGITNVSDKDFNYAKHFNCVIRLIALCEQTEDGVLQWVGPCLIPESEPLAHIQGVTNAVQVDGDMVDSLMLQGPGAGGAATASSVLADLQDVARGVLLPVFGKTVQNLEVMKAFHGLSPSQWYLRLSLIDQTGSMAKVTSILAENGVSIEEVIQKAPDNGDSTRPVIFISHTAPIQAIENALKSLQSNDAIGDAVSVMPVMTSEN